MATQYLRVTATGRRGITEKTIPIYDRVSREAVLSMKAPETFVPEPLRESLIGHIDRGAPTGSFLRALLENDLQTACREAQTISPHHIVSMVRWLWQFAPLESWGAHHKVLGWQDARRRDNQPPLQPVS